MGLSPKAKLKLVKDWLLDHKKELKNLEKKLNKQLKKEKKSQISLNNLLNYLELENFLTETPVSLSRKELKVIVRKLDNVYLDIFEGEEQILAKACHALNLKYKVWTKPKT